MSGASQLIRALIITASVVCAGETSIRVGPGPKARKRYLLVACTSLLTCYFPGDRSLASFQAFVFPGLAGAVVVHDRYCNYDKYPGITRPYAIRGYVSTAARHGINVFTAPRGALTGNARMPPIPADA